MKSTAVDPHAVGLLIFDKDTKAVLGSKENLFNRWCWNTGQTYGGNMKFDPYFIPFVKINLKWIIDINIKTGLKTFQKKTWKNSMAALEQAKTMYKSINLKGKNDKLYFIK